MQCQIIEFAHQIKELFVFCAAADLTAEFATLAEFVDFFVRFFSSLRPRTFQDHTGGMQSLVSR